jgi:DNA-binding transcriptional LysR family regulator
LASVIELGSLSSAAARHGVSQPAVSARIRALEKRVGFPLLVRSPSGSRATVEGAVVAQAAAHLLREAGTLAAAIHAFRVKQRNVLRVAASITIAEHLLPGWLESLRLRGLDLSIELRVGNSDHVVRLIESGDADAGFIEAPEPPAGLDSEVVGRDELLVVCAPSHPWARRSRPVSSTELRATRLVVREKGAGGRDLLERRLAELGKKAGVAAAAEVASPAALSAAVAAGIGPGVVSEWAVAGDLASGRLRRVVVDGLDLHRDLRAVWRPRQQPELLEVLLRHVRAVAVRH